MEDLVCNWTPKYIVELVQALAWPAVVLLVCAVSGTRLVKFLKSFFEKNKVSEVSAGTTGITAKFEAQRQSSISIDSLSSSSSDVIEDGDLEKVRQKHRELRTKHSDEILSVILRQIESFAIPEKDKLELMCVETSIIYSFLKFTEINKVLFRSQYDLFLSMNSSGGVVDSEAARMNFSKLRAANMDVFSEWDWTKYIAYPVSHGLIKEANMVYELTDLGESYVIFMSNHPELVDELSKL